MVRHPQCGERQHELRLLYVPILPSLSLACLMHSPILNRLLRHNHWRACHSHHARCTLAEAQQRRGALELVRYATRAHGLAAHLPVLLRHDLCRPPCGELQLDGRQHDEPGLRRDHRRHRQPN